MIGGCKRWEHLETRPCALATAEYHSTMVLNATSDLGEGDVVLWFA